MPLVGGEQFFDGFGFDHYRDRFGWTEISLDKNEEDHPPQKPLLPSYESLNRELPLRVGSCYGKVRAERRLAFIGICAKHDAGASVADAKQAKSTQRPPKVPGRPTEKR